MVISSALVPGVAAAQCDAAASAWVHACDSRMEPIQCGGTRMTVRRAFADDLPLTIEIHEPAGETFRREGDIGLSPVADLPDWEDAPSAWQEALDHLSACVRERSPFARGAPGRELAPHVSDAPRIGSSPGLLERLPWQGLIGCVLLGVLLSDRRRLRAWTAGRPWLLLVLSAGTLALRRLVLEPAFFHQNGQGPLWIETALCQPSGYGPGYRELFGGSAWLAGASPEAGVFLAQSILLSLAPALAFLAARAQGAHLALAAVMGAAFALDPILGRLALSESYFGAPVVLILGACVALSVGVRGSRRRFGLAVLAAGLLLSQAARVHPLTWTPVALVPLVLVSRPGTSIRRALGTSLVAGLGIAAAALVTSASALLEVLDEQLGAWGQHAATGNVAAESVQAALACIVLVPLASRVRARGLVRGIALAACVLVLARAGSIAAWTEPVAQAHARLYLPVLATLAVSGLAGARPWIVRRAPPVLAAVLTLAFIARWDAWTQLPTDALEENVVLAWRAQTAPEDLVVYVERADDHIEHLPIYECSRAHAHVAPIRDDDAAPNLSFARGHLFYIESSVCSTPAGREVCRRAREGLRIERLDGRDLPARRSNPHQPFDVDVVPIWLGEIER